MKPAAQRIGNRLSLEMIIKSGKVARKDVAAKVEERRAEQDAEDRPPEQPEHDARWLAFWKGTPIEERAKENRQEACFEQLNLPAVAVPLLADMDERHIERP